MFFFRYCPVVLLGSVSLFPKWSNPVASFGESLPNHLWNRFRFLHPTGHSVPHFPCPNVTAEARALEFVIGRGLNRVASSRLLGLPFVFLPLLSCGSSQFSFAFPKMVYPCGSFGESLPNHLWHRFRFLHPTGRSVPHFPCPNVTPHWREVPPWSFSYIAAPLRASRTVTAMVGTPSCFRFPSPSDSVASPPKNLSPRDLVRREDSPFMESPAGLLTPGLNLTISVASRQFIKLFAHVFQR